MLSDGHVVVISGGGSGIGRGIALAFSREHARVAVVDRDLDAACRVAAECGTAGALDTFAVQCDVTHSDEVNAAVNDVEGAWGRLDTLVCAAGIREIGDVLTMDPAVWEETIAVDLSGTFYCSQAAGRVMARGDGGTIITIASVNGLIGEPQRPAYVAAKHGVVGLTKTLARDLARHKIRVNAICPGLIDTPLTEPYFEDPSFADGLAESVPLGRAGEPREIGDAAVFLASERASFITGTSLVVDGGFLADKPFGWGGAYTHIPAGPTPGTSVRDQARRD